MTPAIHHHHRGALAQHKSAMLLSREEIAAKVVSLGREISRDYEGKDPLLLGVLKGSFVFVADLIRQIDIELSVDFIRAQSYYSTASSGHVALTAVPGIPLRDRHVLLVDDIVDTGATVDRIIAYINGQGPASLKVCALLDKPSRRVTPVTIDYLGFTVPGVFVVGYGLDHRQKYRNLPGIYVLEEA